MSEKRFGILGGMGPESTVYFYKLVLQLTNAHIDQEHLEAIIAILPHIPDRTAAILTGGSDPTPEILDGINLLAQAGAEFAVITCNTAHYFLHQIQELTPIPVLDMIQLVADDIEARDITRVGLLATSGTIQTCLYDQYLTKQGVKLFKPDNFHQESVMKLIYGACGIKAGFLTENNRDELFTCTKHLLEQGAEAIILGCTELALILDQHNTPDYFIDPLLLLAKASVKKAKGDIYGKT